MGQLIIGEHTYGTIIRRGDMNNITVGKYCSLASGIVADSGFNHNTEFISTYPFNVMKGVEAKHINTCKGDINIGNDVWIGEDVLIMAGVNIGNGAVIGARSIVTKDVPPYSINVGIPNKTIKSRFTVNQIQSLLKIKWWDWPLEKVLTNAHLLNDTDINKFITIHG